MGQPPPPHYNTQQCPCFRELATKSQDLSPPKWAELPLLAANLPRARFRSRKAFLEKMEKSPQREGPWDSLRAFLEKQWLSRTEPWQKLVIWELGTSGELGMSRTWPVA